MNQGTPWSWCDVNTHHGSTGDFCSVFLFLSMNDHRGTGLYIRQWRFLISLCTDSVSWDSWERNWVTLGVFLDSTLLCSSISPPLLVSFSILETDVILNHKSSISSQRCCNWIWLAVTTNLAKYRLFGMLLSLFASIQNLDKSEIRLWGTCFASDTLHTGHMMAVLARTGKVERFYASSLSLLVPILIKHHAKA